ncbi:arginine metabolism regulation ii [Fusarium longipes]|uniref:Arginine metabolism regulation ii n=1 Tax=Fusarium longipes TaxID=694270 RepID=A0A395SZ56_9HYPO|nr:arginine metabolism regulation ii [Fusarium longipes]
MPDELLRSPGRTASGKPRKPRNKTFSGCWTCRAKHVKCDEAKPSCDRCRNAGVDCEGYGVRISWASVRNPSTFRRGGKRRSTRRTSERLRQSCDLESVGEFASEQTEQGTSPFNGLGEDELGDVSSDNGPPELSSESPSISMASTRNQQSSLTENPLTNHLNTRIFHSYELLRQGLTTGPPYTSLPTVQPQLPLLQVDQDLVQSPIGQDGINTSTPLNVADIGTGSLSLPGVPESVSRSSSPPNTQAAPQKITRHIDILPNPGLHCELVQHWTLNLCDSLNPVPGIFNPMRSAMIPIALEGSQTDSEISTGATSLFHFICSASAFHLAKKKNTPESRRDLENVALEHHNIGITHLAQNIRHSKDGAHCVALLAAIIICIMNEAVTLPTSFWPLHFRGAVEWVNHIDPQVWQRDETALSIYYMFRGMALVVQTQLLFDGQETSYWAFTNDLGPQPEPYALYTAFGLPQPIFQGLRAMNDLEMRRKSPVHNKPSPEELDRLELELYLSVPNKPDASTTKEYADLIYHHGFTFYYAALIHMKRTLKDLPLVEVQPLVEKALPHLEALPTCTAQRFSPMIWPVAIISFEIADDAMQQRMLKCLTLFEERSELAIWTQIMHLVKELWALRKREGANIKWHQTALGSMSDSFMLL